MKVFIKILSDSIVFNILRCTESNNESNESINVLNLSKVDFYHLLVVIQFLRIPCMEIMTYLVHYLDDDIKIN